MISVGSIISNQVAWRDWPQSAKDEVTAFSSVISYPKGAKIVCETKEADAILIVAEGTVTMETSSLDGGRHLFMPPRPGDILELSSVIANTTYMSNIIAQENCKIVYIPKLRFLRLIREKPELMYSLLEFISHRFIRYVDRNRRDLSFNNLRQRLANALVDMAIGYGVKRDEDGKIILNITQDELASILGVSRQSIYKEISKFCEQGVLERLYAKIIISSIAILRHET